MIRLLLWLGVGCVVLLAAGGTSSAPAAEAQSAAATDEEATPTRADLEVRKAEARVRYAEANLADAEHAVAEGLMTLQDLRVVERELEEAQLALMETQLRAQEWESQRVSLDVKHAGLADALRLLFKDTPYSYVLSPEIGRLAFDPLTIRLKEVVLQTAVRVICDTYDLRYRKEDSIYYFFPRSDVVTIGGRTVPVLGTLDVAYDVEGTLPRPATEVHRSMIVRTAVGGASETRTRMMLERLGGFDELVDLEVESATLVEVAEKLSVPRTDEPGWRQKVIVHPAVPEDIRVTAKVYGMRRDELLMMLVEQTGLDVNVAPLGSTVPEMVHLVPKPELRVRGTGAGGPWETRGLQWRHDSSALGLLRQGAPETGEGITSFGLRLCGECEQPITMPNWQFCPYCGKELPCDEEPGEPSE
jgi:hypothetical protein